MAAVREEGLFEIVISDPNDQVQQTALTVNTKVQMPALAETNPTERPFLPFGKGGVIPAFWKVKLFFTSAATDNVVGPSSSIHIPVTKKNLALGQNAKYPDVLTAENFDDLNDAGTTGITCTAGVRTLLGTYQVPYTISMMLGDESAQGDDKANARYLMVAYDDTL